MEIKQHEFVTVVFTAIFVTLKLCGVIAWTWLWVLSPIWLLPAVLLALYIALWIIIGVLICADHIWRLIRQERKNIHPFTKPESEENDNAS